MQKLKEVYDQRYAGDYREQLSGFEIARWEALDHFITHVLAINDANRVLDYGAGVGLHVGLWEKLFPESSLHFCDISSVVVSVEVMEHVEDLTGYLKDIHRLLKPGGRFVWTTPCANELSIEHIFSFLTGKIEETNEVYRRWGWEEPTHIRRLRSREITKALKECGFDNILFRFRSHLFSFVCTYSPPRSKFKNLREKLMTLDYSLFRRLPNGASMLGSERAEK